MTFIEGIGWLANACFFGRVLVQWIWVERTHECAAPRSFWLLSLVGSLLLGAYAVERGSWVLLVGFAVNSLIYLRNLSLGSATVEADFPRRVGIPLSLGAFVALSTAGVASADLGTGGPAPWILIAVLGQSLWTGRFVLQWWHSEANGRSHFPASFWLTSLCGNLLLLAYATHLRDAVLVAGLALGPIVQTRNLLLTRRGGIPNAGGWRRVSRPSRERAAAEDATPTCAMQLAHTISVPGKGEAPPG